MGGYHYSGRFAIYVVILTIITCPSCKNYKMKRDMGRFYNQTVSLPPSMLCLEGEKIQYLDLQDSRSKIVIWYDSTECASCKIHNLPAFKNLESYCQNMINGPDLVFLFSPAIQNVNQILEEASISTKLHDYPIYIDTANQFYKINPHIPASKLMHSFLMDVTGKVVLVGSPIQNKSMADLYKKTIEEMMN